MRILAIESTCDETAASVVESFGGGVRVLSSVVASSVTMHEKYGGIIPEIAAREQIKSIIPVVEESLKDIGWEKIDAIAASFGPGLMGSLLVGVETAKVLAWTHNKKLLKVNHVNAHLMANFIVNSLDSGSEPGMTEMGMDCFGSSTKLAMTQELPEMPAVGLIASGGHTDFVLLESPKKWKWIGGTRDDAVGEAFDKAARAFGLPYPGGPEIDKVTKTVSDKEYSALEKKNRLPRPLILDKTLDMSFSGLKAAVTRLFEDHRSSIMDNEYKKSMIRDFSEAVTEVLVAKTKITLEKYKPKSLLLGGGVAANSKIREALKALEGEYNIKFFVPELKYCGDNAAMIGAAAILNPTEASLDDSPEPGMDVV